MSCIKLDKCVAVEEKLTVYRREELYKLVNEIMDRHDLETLMIATLSKIAFIDYLLVLDVMWVITALIQSLELLIVIVVQIIS